MDFFVHQYVLFTNIEGLQKIQFARFFIISQLISKNLNLKIINKFE